MSTYQYSPLRHDEIRILELLPGSESDTVSCRLRHVSLRHPPHFTAVSYTWGIDVPQHSIDVNGQKFLITVSLDAMLRHFRHYDIQAEWKYSWLKSSPVENTIIRVFNQVTKKLLAKISRLMWIDAICINQSDPDERVQQVRLMSRIYKDSTRLVIWLGVEENESEKAMRFIAAYAQRVHHEGAGLKDPHLVAYMLRSWKALAMFMSRPWFRRTWVIQEYILDSKDKAVFLCGNDYLHEYEMRTLSSLSEALGVVDYPITPSKKLTEIDYEVITSCWDFQITPVTPVNNDRKAAQLAGLNFLEGLRRWGELVFFSDLYTSFTESPDEWLNNGRYIMPWLTHIRRADATDPRDKIYSILGLVLGSNNDRNSEREAADLDVELLIVDYTATVEDIFSSLVRAIVSRTKRLDILSLCQPDPNAQRTWTPDWTQELEWSLLESAMRLPPRYEAPGVRSRYPFDAAGTSDCVATFASNLTTMTVRGILWDRISLLGLAPCAERDTAAWCNTAHSDFRVICQEILRVVESNSIYCSEENAMVAMWQSLSLGQGHFQNSEDPDIDAGLSLKHFKDWLDGIGDMFSMGSFPRNWSFILTKRGYVGLACVSKIIGANSSRSSTSPSYNIEVDDCVCVLLGCAVPQILRHVDSHYVVIGDIYLHGVMHGEALEALKQRLVSLEDFELH